MSVDFRASIRCDRCGDVAHTDRDERFPEHEYTWKLFPEWGRISGLDFRNVDLCPTCKDLFEQFMALEM